MMSYQDLPKPSDIEAPLKEWLKDGKEKSLKDAVIFVKEHFGISDDMASEVMPSGKETYLQNRIRWAKVSLQQQGLVRKTRRGHFQLVEKALVQETNQVIATDIGLEEEKGSIMQMISEYIEELNQLMMNESSEEYLREKINRITKRMSKSLASINSQENSNLDSLLSNVGYQLKHPNNLIHAIQAYLVALHEEVEEYPDDLLLDDTARFVETDLNSYWLLCHKDIGAIARPKFENKNYADAVESAFKLIEEKVKKAYVIRTNEDKSGVNLMTHAFSENNPIIQLVENIKSDTGKSIQGGYMSLFVGGIRAFRNPKAHENLNISPEQAMREIIFASQLMFALDQAKS